MHFIPLIVAGVAFILVRALYSKAPNIRNTTDQHISSYNYPVESHQVVTSDGYVLKLYRIPYSPHQENQKNLKNPRPVVFIQHGMISSTDTWILNGPDNALPYLFADAGFDVWMGNHRGNVYSRNNINMSPDESKFWDFSWHELAIIDLPQMIDYVLKKTKQKKLHYVGHSQGTTVFFVLLSEMPEYNSKFKTTHMLAPTAFMGGIKSTLIQLLRDFSVLMFEGLEYIPLIKSIFKSEVCSIGSSYCSNILYLLGGWDQSNLNQTLLSVVSETHPAGSSTGQVMHYFQEMRSGYFRQFDHGKVKNKEIYGQSRPPNYNLSNILAPVRLYYGKNDKVAPLADVKKLEQLLPNLVESYEVPRKYWTHKDFLWAVHVKELVYDKIINIAHYYEKTGQQL